MSAAPLCRSTTCLISGAQRSDGILTITYIRTACLFIYKPRVITETEPCHQRQFAPVTKSDFERRATEMKAINLARGSERPEERAGKGR